MAQSPRPGSPSGGCCDSSANAKTTPAASTPSTPTPPATTRSPKATGAPASSSALPAQSPHQLLRPRRQQRRRAPPRRRLPQRIQRRRRQRQPRMADLAGQQPRRRLRARPRRSPHLLRGLRPRRRRQRPPVISIEDPRYVAVELDPLNRRRMIAGVKTWLTTPPTRSAPSSPPAQRPLLQSAPAAIRRPAARVVRDLRRLHRRPSPEANPLGELPLVRFISRPSSTAQDSANSKTPSTSKTASTTSPSTASSSLGSRPTANAGLKECPAKTKTATRSTSPSSQASTCSGALTPTQRRRIRRVRPGRSPPAARGSPRRRNQLHHPHRPTAALRRGRPRQRQRRRPRRQPEPASSPKVKARQRIFGESWSASSTSPPAGSAWSSRPTPKSSGRIQNARPTPSSPTPPSRSKPQASQRQRMEDLHYPQRRSTAWKPTAPPTRCSPSPQRRSRPPTNATPSPPA